ncbi:MAG: hypothetical protein AMXMBFR7_12980 [Planctomycetota bacterium]
MDSRIAKKLKWIKTENSHGRGFRTMGRAGFAGTATAWVEEACAEMGIAESVNGANLDHR